MKASTVAINELPKSGCLDGSFLLFLLVLCALTTVSALYDFKKINTWK